MMTPGWYPRPEALALAFVRGAMTAASIEHNQCRGHSPNCGDQKISGFWCMGG